MPELQMTTQMLESGHTTGAGAAPGGPSPGGASVSAFGDPTSIPALSQPQPEPEVLRLVENSVKAGEAYRSKSSGYWDDFRKKFNGEFYQKQKRGFECRVNKYKQLIDRKVTILTQQPSVDYVVRLDGDDQDPMCEIHGRRIKDVKKRMGYREKEISMLQLGGVFGPSLMKVFYNKMASEGLGDPDFLEIDPRYFGVNPGCKRLIDAKYCFYKRPASISEVKQNYPEKAEQIKADPSISSENAYGQDIMFRTDNAVSDNVTGAVAYYNMLKKNGFISGAENTLGEQAYLTEFFYKDPRCITIHTQESLSEWVMSRPGFGGKNERFYQMAIDRYSKRGFPQVVPLYPHGRIIYTCGKVVLEDIPNPYPDMPYFCFAGWSKPDNFWPFTDVELMSEALGNLHLISSTVAALSTLRNMPPWWCDDNTADVAKFKQLKPNELFLVKPGRKIGAFQIPTTPSDNMALMENREKDAEEIIGAPSILAGARQTGTYGGRLYDQMFDASMGAMKIPIDGITEFREKVGQRILWIDQCYINDERILDYMSDLEEKDAAGPQVTMLNQPAVDTSGEIPKIKILNDMGAGVYGYRIEEGTGMPVNKIARSNQANEIGKVLMQAGLPSNAVKLMLEYSGFPGWRRLFREMEQAFSQMSQTQAQQQKELSDEERRKALETLEIERAKLGNKVTVAKIGALKDQPDVVLAMGDPDQVVAAFGENAQKLLAVGIPPEEIIGIIQNLAGNGPAPIPMGMPPMADNTELPPSPEMQPLES